MAVKHRDRAEIDVALRHRQKPVLVVRLEAAVLGMRSVASRQCVDKPVRDQEPDDIGNRQPFPPQKPRALVTAAIIQIRVGEGREGRDNVARLRKPAAGALLGALGPRFDDAGTRKGDPLDSRQPALGVIDGTVEGADGPVDADHRLGREDRGIVDALENPLDGLDVGLASLLAGLVEALLRFGLLDCLDQVARRSDQRLGLRRQVADGQELVGDRHQLGADPVEKDPPRRHRQHRNLDLGRAPFRLRQCLCRRHQPVMPRCQPVRQVEKLSFDRGQITDRPVGNIAGIGQHRDELLHPVDGLAHLRLLGSTEDFNRHAVGKRIELRTVANHQRCRFQVA